MKLYVDGALVGSGAYSAPATTTQLAEHYDANQ